MAAAVLLAAGPAHGHGVGARSLGTGAQSVEFYYASGEPMAYASVKLFAPNDPAVPFVDGRADRLGRFAFVADEPGSWTVRAEDEEGHKVALTVQAGEAASTGAGPGGLFSPWRIALWFSLSANVLWLSNWTRGRMAAGRVLA